MRILIASGIFAPEAGGPATYAPRLAASLCEAGHTVQVVTYSEYATYAKDAEYPFRIVRVVRGGRLLNRIRFLRAVLRLARQADLIYTLDWFAAGFPVALAAGYLRVPYIVRVGGDYLWEQRYLESGERPITLKEFYARGMHKRFSYLLPRSLISFVLAHAAHVVFNSDTQRQLYETYWALPASATSTIYNPLPSGRHEAPARRSKEIVYWGRFIVMKNLDSLLRAFARTKRLSDYTLTLIGEGPRKGALKRLALALHLSDRVTFLPGMPFASVIERVKRARAFVLPSWTDISPNQVAEALAVGLPALVTKENYLSFRDELPETLNPDSIEDIAGKLDMLGNDAAYREFARKFSAITFSHTWSDVHRQHMEVFERIVGRKAGENRILQLGADRSRRGILFAGTPAYERQQAYAKEFGHLDIIGLSLKGDGAKTIEDGALRVFPTNSFSRLLYPFDVWRLSRRLPRPQVVSVQDPFETGLMGWFITRHLRVPLHVQVHTDFLSPEYARHSWRNCIRVFIAGFVLRRAAGVRAVSERIKNSIEQRYRAKIPTSVLPIFVDVLKFKNAEPIPSVEGDQRFNFRTKILLVARNALEKNIGLAVEAFKKVAPQDACLLLSSDIHQVPFGDIRIFGVGQEALEHWYKTADLVLVPSKYEGYGLVIVEALAAGKPVISTDVGVAREAGAIVTTGDKFADALKEWFEHGPRTGELKNYPYRNFDEYVRAYCDDITSCIQKRPSP